MSLESACRLTKFQNALDTVKKCYPSYTEFIRSDHSQKIKHVLDSLAFVKESMLLKYSAIIKSSELEYVLLALAGCRDKRICTMLESILKHRFKKKLYELNWTMLQVDFTNQNLLRSMSLLALCLKEKYPEDYAASIFSRLESEDGGFLPLAQNIAERILKLLNTEKADIGSFCKSYTLALDSPLAKRVSELFFLQCSRDGFLINRSIFTDLVGDMNAAGSVPLISHYLDSLDIMEYFDELNHSLKERFGAPGKSVEGGFWDSIPKARIDKYIRWEKLKLIENHFGRASKRFRIWVQYFDKMKDVSRNESDELLFMDFGKFVVVDGKGDFSDASMDNFYEESFSDLIKSKNISFIYDRKYFESERERYEEVKPEDTGKNHWRLIKDHVVDARALIIEDIKSEVYRVGYDKVQLLYLKEMLRLKLEEAR